jgi:hypothetical protein
LICCDRDEKESLKFAFVFVFCVLLLRKRNSIEEGQKNAKKIVEVSVVCAYYVGLKRRRRRS